MNIYYTYPGRISTDICMYILLDMFMYMYTQEDTMHSEIEIFIFL